LCAAHQRIDEATKPTIGWWVMIRTATLLLVMLASLVGAEERVSSPVTAATEPSWAERVDEYWGPGVSTGEKLAVFDTFWHTIDENFACFQDLDADWDALRDLYRPEVAAGVSKGRFAAILGRLSLALREAHTVALDREVFWRTPNEPGTPLLVVGQWGQINDFGACVTPLADGSGLVYRAVDDHPMGLVPGEVIVRVDDRWWPDVYPELLEAGLPVTGFWGSSDEGYEHAWLMAVGANWHLFDTLETFLAGSDVQHIKPTAPLEGWYTDLWCTEQLPVSGVAFPDIAGGELVSWGLIEGTTIGYIYVWGWAWDAEAEFEEAVRALMFDHETEGLIIDFRFNLGGNMFMSDPALELLFDEPVSTIDWVTRCDPDDHLGLCDMGISGDYVIDGDTASFYDRPIAVLVGPGAVSSGDQVALRLGFHPMARFFGKSTNTAFNAAALALDGGGFRATYAYADAFLVSNPGEYLTHDPLPVDHPVWLEPDDVVEGIDTVVEAAVAWIENFDRAPRRPSGRATPP
jgi:hypothetical protein